MHTNLTPVIVRDTLGGGKSRNLQHDTESKLAVATGVNDSSMVVDACSNSKNYLYLLYLNQVTSINL